MEANVRIAALNAAAIIVSKKVIETASTAKVTIDLAEEFSHWILNGTKMPAKTPVEQPSAPAPVPAPAPEPSQPQPELPAGTNQQPPEKLPENPAEKSTSQQPSGNAADTKSTGKKERTKKDPNGPVSEPQKKYILDLGGRLGMTKEAIDAVIAPLQNYGEASAIIESYSKTSNNRDLIKDMCAAINMPDATITTILASVKNNDDAMVMIANLKPRVTPEQLKAYKESKQRQPASAAA